MLDEIGKFLLEAVLQEILGESVSGFFRRARSPGGRGIKTLAWLCLAGSITCLALSSRWIEAILIGMALMTLALGVGFWASLVNRGGPRGSGDY